MSLTHTLTAASAAAVVGATVLAGDPGVDGAWLDPIAWDVTAIHAAVFPTGEVLHYSYPGDGDGSRARLWNPMTGQFTFVDWNDDLFCSGLSHLPDGRLYVTGGNDDECEFQGLRDTNVFDPFSRTWTAFENMIDGRWYPTNVTLPDGRVLIFSGNSRICELNADVELFTPEKGLEWVPEGHRSIQLYPRMHVLTSGKVAHVGPENLAFTFALGEGWRQVAVSNFGWRGQGTSVLIPGRTDEIMVIGGASPLTSTCEIIDFGVQQPSFRYTSPLHHARAHADALILPDKTVMVVGGGAKGLYGDPVNVPELFDPDTESWQELPPHVHQRMYHGTTVLLPDARVLIAGDDGPNQSRFWGEIYQPAYLFRGRRPTIAAAPPALGYDRPFSVASPDAASIESVVLVKLSTVTHSINLEQRLLDLDYEVTSGGALRVTGPPSPSRAPPGYYMLFVLDGDGTPSRAAMMRLAPLAPGDVNADGLVNFEDLLTLLGAWGPCPGCREDQNGDGVVDFADVLIVLGNWT